jgi:hypothetical protein
MKTRIVKVATPFSGEYFQPQYRTWYGVWKPIEFFYKSEFEMPGYVTSFALDEQMARTAIRRFTTKIPNVETIIGAE